MTLTRDTAAPAQRLSWWHNINWGHMVLHILLIFGSLVMLLPFAWMLSTSLKQPNEVFTYPPTWIPETLA